MWIALAANNIHGHRAASPVGAEITATAEIELVFGRKIEFSVTANDQSGDDVREFFRLLNIFMEQKISDSKILT